VGVLDRVDLVGGKQRDGRGMMRHFERHKYSGPGSQKFWVRIWKLSIDGKVKQFRRLYKMGVTLQNKEERMLYELRKAEKEMR
jgi:uncharacterized protein YwgA